MNLKAERFSPIREHLYKVGYFFLSADTNAHQGFKHKKLKDTTFLNRTIVVKTHGFSKYNIWIFIRCLITKRRWGILRENEFGKC